MTTDIEFQLNIADADRVLARIAERAAHARPLMRLIGGVMDDEVQENFDVQGRPRWLGLKPRSAKRRGPDHKILQDSGQLRASIQTEAGDDYAAVGSNKVYAAIHHFGGVIDRAPYSIKVRHRLTAKGELMRSAALGGKGLVFAKDSHKRARTSWAAVDAYQVRIPARPFLTIGPGGEAQILGAAEQYLRSLI